MSHLSGSHQPASAVRATTEQSTIYNNMAVLIDGSAASGKAFDTMLYFARTFNGRGAQDRVTVLHAFDSHADAAKPCHLQSQRLVKEYETNLIRARRTYDAEGPQRLSSQVLGVDYAPGINSGIKSNDDVDVAHLTFARTPSTTETAPPLVAALVMKMRERIHPNYIFMGSYGVGGRPVGVLGTTTDYMIRLAPCSVFVIKAGRRVPSPTTSASYVVAMDGGEMCFSALAELLEIINAIDTVKILTVREGHANDEQDKKTQKKALDMCANSPRRPAEFSAVTKQIHEGEGSVGNAIVAASDEYDADFLVLGTCNLDVEHENRTALQNRLGSVSLYSSQKCKCHAIVIKSKVHMPTTSARQAT